MKRAEETQEEGVELPRRGFDLEAAYREHAAAVWHHLRRLGVAERNLEDLLHDVFVAAHRSRERFDAARPLRPWLYGVAFRVASDHLRRAGTRRELQSADPAAWVASPEEAADDRLVRQARRRLLLEALGTLPLERRAVVVLHDVEGLSVPEIAGVLEVPLNTLYSRLRRGRQQLADAVRRLRRAGGEDGDA